MINSESFVGGDFLGYLSRSNKLASGAWKFNERIFR